MPLYFRTKFGPFTYVKRVRAGSMSSWGDFLVVMACFAGFLAVILLVEAL